ncbi:SMP-30/gluconolactonase/LRE family protein [Alkalihalobacillus macyae]|uniref:SMP-30/gluconolactonase/LRE family protein n=1 Tax=Guptibacillus hwajinpoensis TaxID=208199 RepID=UPI00273C085F|nr:SMP-30/gluconolactonase/LRE family protein [Alkalihalobacillus macyae]MDP4549432.1 SMP-30/gluconolactonase/LRE family protein [Alkalihalobacillus macyae]
MEATLVIDARTILGEGPSWDDQKQLLYWVDIEGKKVHAYNPMTAGNIEMKQEQMVGTIAPRESGGLVMAMAGGFYAMNLSTENVDAITDPESHLPDNRFNDGKCDPAGRFWAGTMHLEGLKGEGALYCLDESLEVTKKIDHVSTSNGLAWSPDTRYMYFIDTPTKKVVRYDYDLTTGDIRNPVEVITIPDGEGMPDGMTSDVDGNLWIAHWGGSKVTRWNPDTGERLLEVNVPALNVTSCVFGGKERNELYITTARTNMSEEELKQFPYAGGVFRVKTKTKGSRTYAFKG